VFIKISDTFFINVKAVEWIKWISDDDGGFARVKFLKKYRPASEPMPTIMEITMTKQEFLRATCMLDK